MCLRTLTTQGVHHDLGEKGCEGAMIHPTGIFFGYHPATKRTAAHVPELSHRQDPTEARIGTVVCDQN